MGACLERIGYAKDTGRSWTSRNAEYAVDMVKGAVIKGGLSVVGLREFDAADLMSQFVHIDERAPERKKRG